MTKNILIDKLPTKTWNFLKVNSAEIQWDSESAAKTEENIILKKDEKNEPVRLDNSGAEGYTENVLNPLVTFDNFLIEIGLEDD
jgi:hypothetical protein